jgi:hypothetical protein
MKTLQVSPSIIISSKIRSKKIMTIEIKNDKTNPKLIRFIEKRSLANLSFKKTNKLAFAKYKQKLYRLV